MDVHSGFVGVNEDQLRDAHEGDPAIEAAGAGTLDRLSATAEKAVLRIRSVNLLCGTENCFACVLAGDRTLAGIKVKALSVDAPTDWFDMAERYVGNTWHHRVREGSYRA
jgi:hypothetical protein